MESNQKGHIKSTVIHHEMIEIITPIDIIGYRVLFRPGVPCSFRINSDEKPALFFFLDTLTRPSGAQRGAYPPPFAVLFISLRRKI